jgi:transposase-like protein
MKIKCPYCGSEDFENFDTVGGYDGEDMLQLCTCFDCDKNFRVVYKCVEVEKDD